MTTSQDQMRQTITQIMRTPSRRHPRNLHSNHSRSHQKHTTNQTPRKLLWKRRPKAKLRV